MEINSRLNIPDNEFNFQFARSSGPGGQNVNKVNSKAILSWDISANMTLPEDVKTRFMDRFGNRVTQEGVVVIATDSFRDQAKNREACLNKLKDMILAVAVPPKKRRATKPTRASREERLAKKQRQSEKKKTRGRVHYE